MWGGRLVVGTWAALGDGGKAEFGVGFLRLVEWKSGVRVTVWREDAQGKTQNSGSARREGTQLGGKSRWKKGPGAKTAGLAGNFREKPHWKSLTLFSGTPKPPSAAPGGAPPHHCCTHLAAQLGYVTRASRRAQNKPSPLLFSRNSSSCVQLATAPAFLHPTADKTPFGARPRPKSPRPVHNLIGRVISKPLATYMPCFRKETAAQRMSA